MIDDSNPIDTQYFTNFVDSVSNKDVKGITESLQNILLQGDYMMLDHSSYQAVIMTLLYSVHSRYDIKAEDHRGNGSSDIIMVPKDDSIPMVFELKVVRKESELDKGVDDDISQIHKNRYYNGLKGTVVLVGIAFWGKVVKARVETIDNGDGFSYIHNL